MIFKCDNFSHDGSYINKNLFDIAGSMQLFRLKPIPNLVDKLFRLNLLSFMIHYSRHLQTKNKKKKNIYMATRVAVALINEHPMIKSVNIILK